jgi:hypothetical protein
MVDQITQVTSVGIGSRIMNSIKGILFGIVMFFAAIGILYWNEGRQDMSKIAKEAVEVNSAVVTHEAADGSLVSVSGPVTTTDSLGDGKFLQNGSYLAVERNVEMFAWVEKSESKTTTKTGGTQTTETTYSYVQEWTSNPESGADFQSPAGHENPPLTITSDSWEADNAKIGVYSFSPSEASLPSLEELTLTDSNVTLSERATRPNSEYLFIKGSEAGTSMIDTPALGDVRIAYRVLEPGFDGTLFGRVQAAEIENYTTEDGDQLYRLFTGSREEAIASMHGEHVTSTWIFRLVGFLVMWFGLMALLGPISVVMDILPVFGALSRSLIGAMTFVVALVTSIAVIIVSMLLHSLVAMIVVAVLAVALTIGGFLMYKKNQVSTT